uniref:Uncharacterized protein n=1 Tax=Cacopsylla melanoneura TaxID=428564 RepID=A0A8D9BRK8_9HEMI
MASIKYEKIRIMYVIVHNVHALFARILPNDINTKQSWSLHSRAASIQPATVETQSPSHHRRPGTARLKNAFNQIFTTIYFDSLIQIFRSTRPATEYPHKTIDFAIIKLFYKATTISREIISLYPFAKSFVLIFNHCLSPYTIPGIAARPFPPVCQLTQCLDTIFISGQMMGDIWQHHARYVSSGCLRRRRAQLRIITITSSSLTCKNCFKIACNFLR